MIVDKPEWYNQGDASFLDSVEDACNAQYVADDVEYPGRHLVIRPANGAKYLNSQGLKKLAVELYHLALYLEQ